MQITIVTGMSGSGKTRVIRSMEDMGFFCIDNMPPMLIPKFTEMLTFANGKFNNVAIVVDIRVGDMINQLIERFLEMKESNYDVKLLFLNADDETLVKRYKETRRSHPLDNPKGLLESIREERMILDKLLTEADYVIDTSGLKSNELVEKVKEIFAPKDSEGIEINVMAFGFKYGTPMDADLVFDVRFLANPYYVPELKYKTGNEKEVQDYVMQTEAAGQFLNKLEDMLTFLIPNYISEGKNQLVIGIGCTGGKHRSVTLANAITKRIGNLEYGIKVEHRDIGKDTANVVLGRSEEGTV